MDKIQTIHCPNCGKLAHRQYLISQQLTKTSCPSCDYLLINCSLTAKVVESYAPGLALACR